MNLIGIYCITNIYTNQKYIGRSINIKKRFSKHKRLLRCNIHINKHLQNSWNFYKENTFDFKILLLAEPDELERYEQKYLNSLDYNSDFNICKSSTAPMYKRKHTEITKQKISNGNLGKKMSQSAKNAISKANSGSKRTEKQKSFISERRSYKLSNEDVKRIRKYSKEGLTSVQIANKYNVSSRHIRNIASYRRRRYV